MTDRLDFIADVLTEAARTACRMFGRVSAEVHGTDPNQVVTEADVTIGARVTGRILSAFPGDTVIEEESGVTAGSGRYTWVVDPIDGTSNFAAASPHYAILVGVLDGGEPVAGGVALPAFSDVYLARRGGGLFRNGVRLRPPGVAPLAEALVAYGFDIHSPEQCARDCAEMAKVAARCRGIRASNSAYDTVMTATGSYGAYLNRGNRIWDCVAPHVVVEESGGRMTTPSGAPIDYSSPTTRLADNFEVLACRAELQHQLVRLVADKSEPVSSTSRPDSGGRPWTPAT